MREGLAGKSATPIHLSPVIKLKILNTTSVFGSLHKFLNCRCGESHGKVKGGRSIMYTEGAMSI